MSRRHLYPCAPVWIHLKINFILKTWVDGSSVQVISNYWDFFGKKKKLLRFAWTNRLACLHLLICARFVVQEMGIDLFGWWVLPYRIGSLVAFCISRRIPDKNSVGILSCIVRLSCMSIPLTTQLVPI